MAEKISFTLNQKAVVVEVDPEMMVLDVLREVLNLTGTKHGCDNSTCGTCTIVVNGKAVKSCNLPVKKVAGADIVTVEGLAHGTDSASGAEVDLRVRRDPVRILHPGNCDGALWFTRVQSRRQPGGIGKCLQ